MVWFSAAMVDLYKLRSDSLGREIVPLYKGKRVDKTKTNS